METKPKINMDLTDGDICCLQANVLAPDCPEYHRRTEIIARNILDMMCEKTQMYGGNVFAENAALKEKMLVSFYEGVGRKAKRIPTIMERIGKGDMKARAELLDTYIDIVGYGLMAINDLVEDLQ